MRNHFTNKPCTWCNQLSRDNNGAVLYKCCICLGCKWVSNYKLSLTCAQGVKNHIKAARHAADADKAQPDWKHRQGLDRTAMSEQLDEWVADMRAAGLKHCEPSLTALIQVSTLITASFAPARPKAARYNR